MQLHTLLQFRPHLSNDESSQSTIENQYPLAIESQFPREIAVSLILLFLSMVLLVLGVEAVLHLRILLSKASLVPVMSWMWFLAYCLANVLFGLHILMYFSFRESVVLNQTHLRIEQSLAGISSVTLVPIEKILCASLCESTLGTKHIIILWQDNRFRSQNSTIGTCMRREHSHTLLTRLKQAVLLSEDLAA